MRIFLAVSVSEQFAAELTTELAKKCQEHLDRRTNALRMWILNSGKSALGSFAWRLSTKKLFDLAGEVAKVTKSNIK